MKAPQVPPRRTIVGSEELAAVSFKRGLIYGLGIGLAIAVIVFFLARFMGRPDRASPAAPPCEPQATGTDAGTASDPRLTAEGPMQVSVVVDAGGPDVPAQEAEGATPQEDQASAPADATDATPSDAEQAAVDTAPAPTDMTAAPADRAVAADARTTATADAGRAVDARTDTGRVGTAGSVSAEDLARANELVTQGDAALAARDFGGARAAYQEALQLHPQNNRAKIGLGRAAFQQGNFEEAVQYLQPIYRNQGNMDLGMAYVRVGRLGDAQRQFEKLLERNPNNTDAQRALEAVNRQLGQ
jgi:Flp pilus assembly protein TadD